jgi:hypothetical protein
MLHRRMMKPFIILSSLLFLVSSALSQSFLDADSTGDAYARITARSYGYEVPDCVHPVIHITEEWDNLLRKYVFVFYLHKSIDNDRCINFDRQRTEIKTWSGGSPDSMLFYYRETSGARWKFKLDSAFQPSANFTHIHQIKAGDGTYDTDNPLITITPVKASTNRLELRFMAPVQEGGNTIKLTTTALAPFLGEWVEAYETATYDSISHGSYSLTLKRLSDDATLLSYSTTALSLWRRGITHNRPKYGIYRSLLDSNSLRDEGVRFADFYLKKGTNFALPAAPGALSASAASSSQINLHWTDNSFGEGMFRIDRSVNGTTWAYYASARANATSFTDTGLAALTTYYYRIRAENTYGNSAFTDSAVATTFGASKTTQGSGNWGSTTPGLPWPDGIVPTSIDNVAIRSTDTVTVDIAAASCANLVVDGTLRTSKAIPIGLTVNGNITVNPGGAVRAQSANTGAGELVHSLTVYGNILHSGPVWDMRTGTAGTNLGVWNIVFAGSGNSTVTMNGAYSSTNGDFNGITINKSGTGRVILGSDINISGGSTSSPSTQSVLTFVHGVVETGNFTLIHQSGTSTNITGASASSYVLGALGRGMSNSGGSAKDFPVGDAAGYRPFTLRSTTGGTATGHYATVRVVSGDANTGSSTLNGGIDRISAVRYYQLTYTRGSAGAASMSFDRFYPTYGTDDGVIAGNRDLRVAYSTNTRATWTKLGQISNPHLTDLTSPPTLIRPDSLSTPVSLASGGAGMYIALADTLGGGNPLGVDIQYAITVVAGSHGSITPDGLVMVDFAADQLFSVFPSPGYYVDSLIVDGVRVDSTTSYTFHNVRSNHSIRAVFRILQYSITAGAGAHGTIIPSGVIAVDYGSSLRFTWIPDPSYRLDTLLVDGVRVDSSAGYTFANVTGNHSIHAQFSLLSSTFNVPLAAGWNLVSLPVSSPIPGDSVRQLFTASVNNYAFEFNAGLGYLQRYRLENGKGYWEKFDVANSQALTGTPILSDTIAVAAGWNIVGSVSCTVDTTSIVANPPGLRSSNWFSYAGGYTPTAQLAPGKGYWVKSAGTGTFTMSCGVSAPIMNAASSVDDVLNSITISDARGRSQTLYFGTDAAHRIALSLYDMPPKAPQGAFDARFETADGGSMVSIDPVSGSSSVASAIALQSDAYPLVIMWKMRNNESSYELMDGMEGRYFVPAEMSGEGSIKLMNNLLERLFISRIGEGGRPATFAVSQNYPNPFNPVTTIRYALPVDSRVQVDVLDVLGQRVRTLNNGQVPSGYHMVVWDGKNNDGLASGSGVYFLKVSAEGMNGVRFNHIVKAILLK